MTIHEKSCGTIVYYIDKKAVEPEILLLHYPEGHWDLPKGHVEKDEEEIETALRELEEETGIKDVEVIKNFKEKIHYFFKKKEGLISKVVMYFLVKVTDKKVKISHEHQDFIWLPYNDAIQKITFKNIKDIVEKAKKSLV